MPWKLRTHARRLLVPQARGRPKGIPLDDDKARSYIGEWIASANEILALGIVIGISFYAVATFVTGGLFVAEPLAPYARAGCAVAGAASTFLLVRRLRFRHSIRRAAFGLAIVSQLALAGVVGSSLALAPDFNPLLLVFVLLVLSGILLFAAPTVGLGWLGVLAAYAATSAVAIRPLGLTLELAAIYFGCLLFVAVSKIALNACLKYLGRQEYQIEQLGILNERQRQEHRVAILQKDLEVAGAVQTLLLPKVDAASSSRFQLVSYYQSASQAGGDWWCHEAEFGERLRLYVGDVTGHGAGAAMITAAVTGCYRALRRSGTGGGDARVPTILTNISECLRDIGGKEYLMSVSALEFDLSRGKLGWWNAAAPPILVMPAGSSVTMVAGRGALLGLDTPEFGFKELEFAKGDRVVVLTDGIPEIDMGDGELVGMRRVARLIEGTRNLSLEDCRGQLVAAIDGWRAGRDLEDDLTFVMVECVA